MKTLSEVKIQLPEMDININKENEKTALDWAKELGHTRIIKILKAIKEKK
jgi:hypothetical protein